MAKENQDSRFKKILVALVSPTAIGIYLTIALSLIAWVYYSQKEAGIQSTGFLKYINDIDQISIDYRLLMRGPRAGSPSAGVLAIDDRSIEIVGRWPWPRQTLGKALDNAYKYGAKIIAADVVWSEPSDRPELRLVEELSEQKQIPDSFKAKIQDHLVKTDPDAIFADYLDKNKSKFIVGNFYSESSSWYDHDLTSGYENICHDLIFKNHQLKQLADKQATPLVVIDSAEDFLPDEILNVYEVTLEEIEQNTRARIPAPKSAFERYHLEREVLKEKIAYCDHKFLHPDRDENTLNIQSNWQQIKEMTTGLNANSFDEWMTNFKSRNLFNAVPETLYWTLSLPEITAKNENFGYFNALLESDGKIRRSQLVTRTGSVYMPSIALQAYLLATGYHAEIEMGALGRVPGLKGIRKFKIADEEGEEVYTAPVTAEGSILINYAGPGKTIPHASIADLLDESNDNILVTQKVKDAKLGWRDQDTEVPKSQFFKDKVLVLGATAIGVFDLRVTPFDENFPGVETHANVIDNLLRRDFLSRSASEEIYMPLFLLLMGLIMSLALSHFGALWGLAFTVITVAIISFVDRSFLFGKGHLVSIALPIIQVVFTYMFLTFYKYLTEERNKKELRATFSKYVSPAIVEEILKDPKNLELGGRKERVTVFFSDVRGFTTISEKLDPRALSDLLNSYLTPMTDLVFKNQGTLDKYMGDAIMAFFGAPVHYADHAKMACRCALQNLEKLKELQAIYEKKRLPQIDIGIGLNTGECSVGNMGSETVRSYTVMGDAVNLASRLEGINKTYGTHIIISEFTHEDVKNDFLCREVDWVRVKGKLKPVKIFELLAEGQAPAHLSEMKKYFAEGYELYHQKQFDRAIQLFSRAIEKNSFDETSKIYIERCQEYIAEPPPPDWDGVYVMKTK